ncbi:MAG: hypothetical protein COB53_12030 [Elusimicrobia bacterium]|nr:MAG: hypothetical protein COB53_12030 [Elusimicrobiota bacterium]
MKKRLPQSPASIDRVMLAVTTAILASTFAFSPWTSEIYGITKIIAVASAAAFACGLLAFRGVSLRSTAADFPLAVFCAAFAASLAVSPDPWLGSVGTYSLYNYGLAAFVLAASIYAATAASDFSATSLLRLLTIAGLISGVYASFQWIGLAPAIGRVLPQGRAVGAMGDPVFLGASLVACIAAAIYTAHREKGVWRRLGFAGFLASWMGVIASGSRGAVLGGVCSIVAYAIIIRFLDGKPMVSARRAILSLAVALTLGATVFLSRPTTASDHGRVAVWKTAVTVFKAHPILGVGPDRFQTALRTYRDDSFLRLIGSKRSQVSAHNDWLQVLATMGFLGFAALMWLHWGIVDVLRDAWAQAENQFTVAASAAALIGLFVQAKVNPLPLVCWIQGAALAGAMVRGSRRRTVGVSRAVFAAAGGLSVVIVFAGLGLYRADAAFAAGHAEVRENLARGILQYELACERNPYELHYRVVLSKAYYAAAARAKGAAAITMLRKNAANGDAGARRRPSEVEGHLIAGTARLTLGANGASADLDHAARSFEQALAIDPNFLPTLENALQLATLRGDAAYAAQLRAELERVHSVGEGS